MASFAEAMAPRKRRHTLAEQFAWCEANVPDQHPGFAVSSAQMLAAAGLEVTPDAIRARLRRKGYEASQIGYVPVSDDQARAAA